MIPYISAEHLVSVYAAPGATGHAWAAVVHTPDATHTAADTMPSATEGEALYTALAAALARLPSDGQACVILPSVSQAPFGLAAEVAEAIASRAGTIEFYPDAACLGEAAVPLANAARSLAEATARGDGGA